MSDDLDRVRRTLEQAEDVEMPEGLGALPDEDQDLALGDEDADLGPDAPHPPSDLDPEVLSACAGEPLNDFGNGQRFMRHFGADARYVPGMGWHLWTGTHFALDRNGLVVRARAQKLGALIAAEIPFLPIETWQQAAIDSKAGLQDRRRELREVRGDDGKPTSEAEAEIEAIDKKLKAIADIEKSRGERRKAHRNFARTAGNSGRIDAALKEAAPHISCLHDQMDADPMLVNTRSGVLRFQVVSDPDSGMGKVASVQLVPHDRAYLQSRRVEADWRPDARADRFHAFFNRVQPAREMRGFLQRWFGLSMLGVPIQALLFNYGAGANGKSVLIETIAKILGDYAAEIRIETLTGKGQADGSKATPDLVYLVGARLARASEPREGELLQDALIKAVTSGEPIMVRPNYGEFFRLYPYFKLTMSGNHKPEIRSSDDGIWRRMKLVPWDVQIPEAERDPDLIEKLLEERDGILQWLVDGALDFLENGLQEPDTVRMATQEYREDSDPVGAFIASCCHCTGDDRDRIPSLDLARAFNWWLEGRGEGRWTERTVSMRIKAKAKRWISPRDGRGFQPLKTQGVIIYTGIRFDDQFGPRYRLAPRDHEGRPLAGGSSDGLV